MAASEPAAPTHLRFWERAQVPFARHLGSRWPLLLALALPGAVVAFLRGDRAVRLAILHGGAIAVAYTLLGVPFFSWYVVPCVVAMLVGAAHACVFAARLLPGRLLRAGAAAALVAIAFWQPARAFSAALRSPQPAARTVSYRRAGDWIRSHSPPRASIAYVEIGVLGYVSDRPLLDLMGLVTPWARPYVARGDLLGALRRAPTDFVLAHSRGRMNGIVQSRWFGRRYVEVWRIDEPMPDGGTGTLTVYRRQPRAALAAAR
jgi:hypothetical protein